MSISLVAEFSIFGGIGTIGFSPTRPSLTYPLEFRYRDNDVYTNSLNDPWFNPGPTQIYSSDVIYDISENNSSIQNNQESLVIEPVMYGQQFPDGKLSETASESEFSYTSAPSSTPVSQDDFQVATTRYSDDSEKNNRLQNFHQSFKSGGNVQGGVPSSVSSKINNRLSDTKSRLADAQGLNFFTGKSSYQELNQIAEGSQPGLTNGPASGYYKSGNFQGRLEEDKGFGSTGKADTLNSKNVSDSEPNIGEDQIVFFFHDVVNNKYIPFRSTIVGLTQDNSPEWEDIQYLGRADKVFVYKGFTRGCGFAFRAYCNSASELAPMWQRINYLVGLTMPSKYTQGSTGGSFVVPPFVKLRIGDLIRNQPCILRSVNVTVPEDASWETLSGEYIPLAAALQTAQINGDAPKVGQFPMLVDIAISATFIEKERPEVGLGHFGDKDDTKGISEQLIVGGSPPQDSYASSAGGNGASSFGEDGRSPGGLGGLGNIANSVGNVGSSFGSVTNGLGRIGSAAGGLSGFAGGLTSNINRVTSVGGDFGGNMIGQFSSATRIVSGLGSGFGIGANANISGIGNIGAVFTATNPQVSRVLNNVGMAVNTAQRVASTAQSVRGQIQRLASGGLPNISTVFSVRANVNI